MGQGMRLVIQAAYFIIIARSLGTRQYGAFVAVCACTQILGPFVGVGCGSLMIKNVARDRSLFSEYWGNSLLMTVGCGLAFMAIVMAIGRIVLPVAIPTAVIVLVGISELLFSKLLDCAGWAFQSIERLDVTAFLNILISLSRLIGIGVLALVVHHPTAEHWSFVYLLTTVFSAAVGLVSVHVSISRPKVALHRIRQELVEGFYFSGSLAAQTIYNDIDKTMLARFSTLDATGIYAAAYRLVDVSFTPVRALLAAAYPGFFRAGSEGTHGTLRYMKRLLPKAAWYGLFAFVALFVCAPVVPHVLGQEYARTVEALRWLSLLPLLKTIHYFLSDALTGSGHQGLRTLMQSLVAVFNVLINLWLIPAYGWRGAAWSSLASDALLVIAILCAIGVLLRAERGPIIAMGHLAPVSEAGSTCER